MTRQWERRGVLLDQVDIEAWEAGGLPHGLLVRVLNFNIATGARTLVVEVPRGWENPVPHWHSCDEEFLVLGGEIDIGGRTYGKGNYVFRPAGRLHGPTRCAESCRLLYWHDGAFDVRVDDPPDPPSSKPEVDGVDTNTDSDAWELLPGERAMEIKMIRLRNFEETGCDMTLEHLPRGSETRSHDGKRVFESHPADEEAVILEGWGGTDAKHIQVAGSYLYWKGGTIHGPTRGWDAKIIVKHYGKMSSDHYPAPEQWQAG